MIISIHEGILQQVQAEFDALVLAEALSGVASVIVADGPLLDLVSSAATVPAGQFALPAIVLSASDVATAPATNQRDDVGYEVLALFVAADATPRDTHLAWQETTRRFFSQRRVTLSAPAGVVCHRCDVIADTPHDAAMSERERLRIGAVRMRFFIRQQRGV